MSDKRNVHTPEQIAFFRSYRDSRLPLAPDACTGPGPLCWVDQGPPALDPATGGVAARCAHCHGAIRATPKQPQ